MLVSLSRLASLASPRSRRIITPAPAAAGALGPRFSSLRRRGTMTQVVHTKGSQSPEISEGTILNISAWMCPYGAALARLRRRLDFLEHQLTSCHRLAAQRSWIALNESGLSFETVFVDLVEKPEWLFDFNPLGKVGSPAARPPPAAANRPTKQAPPLAPPPPPRAPRCPRSCARPQTASCITRTSLW
jgi:hypothetical protein